MHGTRGFQSSPLFEKSARFYVTISGNFERFQYFNFETNFLENKNLFSKIFFTKAESASFPYKTALSEANVKAVRIVSTKRTYHKERSFASKYFNFLKLFFQFKDIYKELF